MPDQGEYFGGNGGYQRQPVNGGYSSGNFPANNPPQTAQTAQAAYSRGAGAFPYSRQNRPNGFVSGSQTYGSSGYGGPMNGNAVNGNAVNGNIMNGSPARQPVPNMNFPTNSGIRQFQQNGQGGQGQNNNYRNNFGNRNSPFINNYQSPRSAPPPEPENIPEPTLSVPKESGEDNDSKKSSLLSLLDGIKIDPEKATLVLLIVILARNDADITLIMALAYLLM